MTILKNKYCIIFLILLCCFYGNSNQINYFDDPPMKFDIDTIELRNDTLVINLTTYGDDDQFIFCPFGDYLTITDFKKHNEWSTLFKETKFANEIYKGNSSYYTYCYCDSTTQICFFKGYHWLTYPTNLIHFASDISYTTSPRVTLKHDIHIGITLQELLTKFGVISKYNDSSVKAVQLTCFAGENHFYLFDKNVLVKIIFYAEGVMFKYECGEE